MHTLLFWYFRQTATPHPLSFVKHPSRNAKKYYEKAPDSEKHKAKKRGKSDDAKEPKSKKAKKETEKEEEPKDKKSKKEKKTK